MYDLQDIRSIHLEITSKCQARCPMCSRRIQGGPLMPGVTLQEITLADFKSWFSQNFVKQLTHLNMCGNLGDAVIAKDTVLIFEYLRSNNEKMTLQMHTNGSARNKNFWTRLAELNVTVVFGIDGLADTHSKYRINTDWHKIINNAKTFITAGGSARWDMLVFDHNKHQVEECHKLSDELGFKSFLHKNSSRFKEGEYRVLNDEGKTIDILYPTEKSKGFIDKIKLAQNEIKPEILCKAKKFNEIYIASNGNVSPCCWLDMQWMPTSSWSRIDFIDKIYDMPNLHKNSLSEIFNSGYFKKISDCWDSTGLRECSKQCGTFNRLAEQFENRQST